MVILEITLSQKKEQTLLSNVMKDMSLLSSGLQHVIALGCGHQLQRNITVHLLKVLEFIIIIYLTYNNDKNLQHQYL